MNAFNESVIEEFRANGGKVGGPFEGRDNMVVITTIGAKSGRAVTNPLVYVPDGERIVLIASNGGADKHPAWYHNLRANPELTVELGTETYTGKAEFLTGAEADELYERMIALMPVFAEYRTKTTRKIPVVAVYRTA
ncbi:nitroreductase family deazaflavin-dependent oxidoreductase [Nocardia sp. CDC160]|uniref:nitroreductase family deazaflavin-dependent oxidoreductase n=1 Tax=Nocardia sp. CDC160 TaxID=3112166 RepID=UPI002DB575E7|nr:nitroreductase family deazaflavin-dependent oxidoreductase [Nocardia sp. CDC160]MEC3913186.1 nitroreductase family deazaflavin-dependent oxidoreductase [Nocardia sp. CDC160]